MGNIYNAKKKKRIFGGIPREESIEIEAQAEAAP